MGLRFSVLASGSTGNATLVQTDRGTIMVDAGLSAKKLEQLMKQVGTEASEVSAILVTHEHADHIKGLGAFARKYKLKVFANDATWKAMEAQIGELEAGQREVLATGDMMEFGGMRVESYAISHDAADPVGYCFYCGDRKLGLATDLGYMSTKVKEKLLDSDALVLESNHDVGMLRMGRYPWNIKRRILGDTGHLSNEAAGEALIDLLEGRTRKVYLAHLSRDHNLMDLARLTVNNILEERGISLKSRSVELRDTYYDRPTAWDAL